MAEAPRRTAAGKNFGELYSDLVTLYSTVAEIPHA